MKKYKKLFVENTNEKLIDLFKSYFLNEEEFGSRLVKISALLLKRGMIILDNKVLYNLVGKRQDCETNSYKFAKQNKMQVVQGYCHNDDEGENYWFGHTWVYDPIKKIHIEVTPGIENSEGRIGRLVKKEMLKVALGKWGSLKNRDYEKL